MRACRRFAPKGCSHRCARVGGGDAGEQSSDYCGTTAGSMFALSAAANLPMRSSLKLQLHQRFQPSCPLPLQLNVGNWRTACNVMPAHEFGQWYGFANPIRPGACQAIASRKVWCSSNLAENSQLRRGSQNRAARDQGGCPPAVLPHGAVSSAPPLAKPCVTRGPAAARTAPGTQTRKPWLGRPLSQPGGRMLHRTLRHDFAESEGLVDNSRNLDPIVKREQRQKAAELCRKTWAKLQKAREQAMLRSGHTSNFGLNSGELLVLAAECCAKNGLFDDARDCAEEFFVDDCATSQGSQDQFLCRAKFVQAQVECNNAKPLQGADGSEGDASRGVMCWTR